MRISNIQDKGKIEKKNKGIEDIIQRKTEDN